MASRPSTVRHAGISAIAAARSSCGMLTLREDGVRKIFAGLTSVDEVLRVTGGVLEA